MGNVSKKDKVDSRTGISRNEKKAIRESWRAFRENNPGYSYLLFTGLFMKNPLYLNLFVVFRGKSLLALQDNPKFRAHASAVGYQFSAMVDSLDDPDVLVELIRKNAVNHLTRKGVQAVHFESLCKVTMEIMAEKVPSKMNYEAVCGWDKLFEVSSLIATFIRINENVIFLKNALQTPCIWLYTLPGFCTIPYQRLNTLVQGSGACFK